MADRLIAVEKTTLRTEDTASMRSVQEWSGLPSAWTTEQNFMSLINSSILAGLLLAAIPLVLHLVMRARPKRIEFPALQLLRVRQASNARRMRLRQVLLLVLRVLLLLILVLAIARPSLPAADYGLKWWEWAGLVIAAAMAVALYRWLLLRQSAAASGRTDPAQQAALYRVFSLLSGLLLAVLLTGLPWAVRVRAELLSPGSDGSQQVPVAAVFLVDNSISMRYLRESRTRLEYAAEVIQQQLERFPQESQAAVATLDQEEPILIQADLAGLSSRTSSISATAVPGTLNRRLKDAIEAQIEHRAMLQQQLGIGGSADRFAREIYVLSDLSPAAWQLPDESRIAEMLAAADWLHVYVVNLSVSGAINAAITELQIGEQSIVAGRDLTLSMTVSSTPGLPEASTVETILLDESGREIRSGVPALVRLNGESMRVSTSIRLPNDVGWLQGTVRLTSNDPLLEDNSRFFSVRVQHTPRLLLIADMADEALYLQNALQPAELSRLGITLCDCQVVTTAAAGDLTLSEYDAVFLCGLQRPDDSLWTRVTNYVRNGGGVVLVAGSDRLQPLFWSSAAAQNVVPATPLTVVRYLTSPGYLRLDDVPNSLGRSLATDESLRVELGAVAFDRCWAVEPQEDSSVILSLTGPGNRPALLERRIGSGRCLMFTSAMDNLADRGNLWNNLVNSWSFLAFTDELVRYLTVAGDQQSSFTAGTPVDFEIPPGDRFEQFLLQRPGMRQTRGTLAADSSVVLITDASEQGHYTLRPFESASEYRAPFSVNIPDAESLLEPVDDEQLLQLLGRERSTIIDNPQDLASIVRVSRVGIEVFPILLGLLLLLFCAEHIMANCFYDQVNDTLRTGVSTDRGSLRGGSSAAGT